jgi:hypothetical protein
MAHALSAIVRGLAVGLARRIRPFSFELFLLIALIGILLTLIVLVLVHVTLQTTEEGKDSTRKGSVLDARRDARETIGCV